MDGLQQVALGMDINVWPTLIVERKAKATIGAGEGVSITFALKLKPEAVGPFTQAADMFDAAAARPGFLGIRMVQHKDDPTRILFIERWESEDAYGGYVDWQAERGGMAQIAAITESTEMNVWPKLVVEA
jgi:quinol monooxygenase YgiN